MMTKVRCEGVALFHFENFQDWVCTAQIAFRNLGHTHETTLCVDQNGMVCNRGKQFKEAAYPVSVYAIDDPPFKPSGMLGTREAAE
jgi:hypothetical protein